MKKLFILAVAIMTMGFIMPAQAQWSDNPNQNVQISDVYTWGEEMKVDDQGNYYFYYLQPEEGLNIMPYVKKLDKNGVEVWDKPVNISRYKTRTYTLINDYITLDREGNVIAVVCDNRLDEGNKQWMTYTAYKISPDGKMLWGEEGINLVNNKSWPFIASMRLVNLEDNSTIFIYNMQEEENEKTMKISMSRLSAKGDVLYSMKDFQAEGDKIQYPYTVNAGNNEFYMLYTVGTSYDLYMQKLDFDGNPVWSTPTLVYDLGGFGNGGAMQVILNVVPAKDGVLVSWNDDRNSTWTESVFMAYIDKNGKHKFATAEEGLKVGYSGFRQFSPEAVYDYESDNIFIAFIETNAKQSERGVTVQKVSAGGELLWEPEGLSVVDVSEQEAGQHSIQMGLKGSICAFYMTQKAGTNKTALYAKLIDADGKPLWEAGNIKLINGESAASSTRSLKLMNNQWVVSFKDNRVTGNLNDAHYYAQNISIDGKLGVVVSSNESSKPYTAPFVVAPNPIKDVFTVSIPNINSDKQLKIELYNMAGSKVANLFDGKINSSAPISLLRPFGTPSGVYILKAISDKEVQDVKLILQ